MCELLVKVFVYELYVSTVCIEDEKIVDVVNLEVNLLLDRYYKLILLCVMILCQLPSIIGSLWMITCICLIAVINDWVVTMFRRQHHPEKWQTNFA